MEYLYFSDPTLGPPDRISRVCIVIKLLYILGYRIFHFCSSICCILQSTWWHPYLAKTWTLAQSNLIKPPCEARPNNDFSVLPMFCFSVKCRMRWTMSRNPQKQATNKNKLKHYQHLTTSSNMFVSCYIEIYFSMIISEIQL